MDNVELIPQAFAWTAARIATVPAEGLDRPTPCSGWNLQDLLDHTIGALTGLTDAVLAAPAKPGPDAPDEASHPAQAIAELAHRSRRGWATPGVMDRTFELPIGTMTAPMLAGATLLEAVVHGWDISQSTGEAADIPDALSLATLEFARQALDDVNRGDNFADDLGVGDKPSDQLVAFLGRRPL
jgi:uncharacterized protein (TIGR03086 family)